MKVKEFLKMGDMYEQIEIIKCNGEVKPFKIDELYKGNIVDYFMQKKQPNGIIKAWGNEVYNGDYIVMTIEIE